MSCSFFSTSVQCVVLRGLDACLDFELCSFFVIFCLLCEAYDFVQRIKYQNLTLKTGYDASMALQFVN
jgi:hypothetical protein